MEELAIGLSVITLLYSIFVLILTKFFFSERKQGKISLKRFVHNLKEKLFFDDDFRELHRQ